MSTEFAGRAVGMYTAFGKNGIASCRLCLVIARNDGTVVMANASASAPSGEEPPTVTIPGLTVEQLETIVATATGTVGVRL